MTGVQTCALPICSYIHGLFDAPGVCEAILRTACEKKGIRFETLGSFDAGQYRQRQYDLLADGVRGGLDMETIYRIINREV